MVWSAAEKYTLVAAKLYGDWYPDSQGNRKYEYHEFNDLKEMRSLTQIIKQIIYRDYKAGTNNLRHQINIV